MNRENKKEYFTDLYNQSFDYVYSYIFARAAGNCQLTEDIVQETYAAAWLSLDRFDEKCTYRTWLCSIAKNKLRENYRKAIYREKHEIPDNESFNELVGSFDLEKLVLYHEMRSSVLEVLEGMCPLYRYALIMKYMDGQSVKEIAKVLGKTAKAVDGVLQRAKTVFERAYLKVEGSDRNNG